jgi:hypothetical protein
MTTAAVPVPARVPWWTRTWAGVLFALLFVVCAWFFLRWRPVADWITYWTGQDAETGGKYGFWSGFGGSMPDILLITGGLAAWWHLSCHRSGCWLPGSHRSGDGSIRVCRFHHPDIRGRKLTGEVIQELHELHLTRLAHRAAPARKRSGTQM